MNEINTQEEALSRLLRRVEEKVGREMKTPKDFEFLSAQIFEQTRRTISVSTLKRVWGYIDSYRSIRESTLDLLAQFASYDNYQHFCQQTQSQQAVFTPPVKIFTQSRCFQSFSCPCCRFRHSTYLQDVENTLRQPRHFEKRTNLCFLRRVPFVVQHSCHRLPIFPASAQLFGVIRMDPTIPTPHFP